MSTKNEIKPVALSEVDKQMEFYKRAVEERDRLREALVRAVDTLQYIADRREEQSVTKLHLGEVAKSRLTDARAVLKEGK